ncbi:dienelactone hydrolase family protein [Neobacillus rhizophilus]|uniref:Dienelactone hydrolase family protein n=1 Tax=Neobacillus rhizophilus TaxID=2833579 RepID=A0A942U7J3_9BACI|nr:dienelactone hydrolase family protein [Neobacillus rhizophilus]MBS4213977.1 dienelactone hydrolase family protein [Neobacillus rhizophilus]MBU8917619.1 dienelactone hydrolase family protein [Bacillus sp. FJAT-29953]
MLQILKNSSHLIIVIHEIYGINQHMENFCELLSKQDFDVICPNLIEREQPFTYSEEEIAYHHFMNNVGFSEAVHKIKNLLLEVKNNYEKIYLIGFSVGATVAWLCSEEDSLDGVVAYYGSRIRNYLQIVPQCPVVLFFPEEEQSFNVDQLISILDKKNIEIHKFNGQHGFSDPYSAKFNKKSFQNALNEMLNFLKKHQ